MSVIWNVAFAEALISNRGGTILGSSSWVLSSVITQFLDQVKVKSTSQLISGTSDVLQKLLRCFNGTENSTSFIFSWPAVFPVILVLYLKDSEFVIGSTGISL